ncbi:hypothetical protein [Empedobacter brevis]|uniref:hypothetical protein n=1 Tax=Empedobacter brevis TaxID=247 RepID=UPI00289DC533|nr:hypothetical protein [Empedobacter brevis]
MDEIDLKDIILNVHQSKSKSNSDLDIDSDGLPEQIKSKKLENIRYNSDTKDRKWLAIWTAAVVSIWLSLVIGILTLNSNLFKLSDSVLISLLGTTTLNVLGLSFIVLRGHFNSTSK